MERIEFQNNWLFQLTKKNAYHNLKENAKAKKCAFIDLLRVQGGLRIIDPMFLKNGIAHAKK